MGSFCIHSFAGIILEVSWVMGDAGAAFLTVRKKKSWGSAEPGVSLLNT